jgi:predicted Fe-Mo cluster-binding NifX family protein
MGKIQKIAIPTDDGHVIGKKFRGSRGFLVATIKSGKIVHQELRWNLLSDMMISEHGSLYNLRDCDIVIVNEIGECQCQRLKAEKKVIIQTAETDIPQAFIRYLKCIPVFPEIN